jgi:hypothetical protein
MDHGITDSRERQVSWVAVMHWRWSAVLCRLLACLVLALVVVLTLTTPQPRRQLRMPDPWAYMFAIENFAQGRWVITDDEVAAGRMQARLRGGHLTQYVNVGPDRWALEKAPGFPLMAVLFQWLGFPQLTNAALALIAAAALYALMSLSYDEGLACASVALFLLTPMSLVAQHDVWMDTFASGAVPLIGGAFYFLYLRRPEGRTGPVLALAAGLVLGWSAVVRLTNALLVVLCGLHLAVTAWRAERRRPALAAVGTFALGAALALGVLAAYNLVVFGRLFDVGYAHSLYRVSSAFGPALGKPGNPVSRVSLSSAVQMVGRNLVRAVQPWLIGFPVLMLAIPGWLVAGRGQSRHLPRWLAFLWALAVMIPYVSFTWIDELLAQPANRCQCFFGVDRYFFPWIFPLTVLAVVALDRLPRWIALALATLCAIGSLWFYLHAYAGS